MMTPPIKEAYKELFTEFKRLTTLKDQLAFWNSGRLPLNYIQYQECEDPQTILDLHPFALHYELPQKEWQWLNHWMLEHYYTLSSHPEKRSQLLDGEDLKASLEQALAERGDPHAFILKELSELEASFVAVPYQWGHSEREAEERLHYRNTRYKADFKAYLDYKVTRRLPDYSQCKPFLIAVLKKANGVTLAQYGHYLGERAKALELVTTRR